MHNVENTGREAVTESEWNRIRLGFQNSIMAETSLNALAEDMGLSSWPVDGEGETPTKYTHLSYDALCAHPTFAVRPELLIQLVEILKQTLAFDDPFGDMVVSVDEAEAQDNRKKESDESGRCTNDHIKANPSERKFSDRQSSVYRLRARAMVC